MCKWMRTFDTSKKNSFLFKILRLNSIDFFYKALADLFFWHELKFIIDFPPTSIIVLLE